MNYQQPDLLEQLAGAYVLGTLQGRARARFEQLDAQSAGVRAARQRWEDRFMPLLKGLEPVTPSDRVWADIARRIRQAELPAAPAGRRRHVPWRWGLAGLVALSLLIGVSIRLLYPPLQVVAVVGQDAAHPLWNVARSADTATLTVHAVQPVQAEPRKSFELWALPRDGRAPVSLGLLPRSGSLHRTLSAAQRAALQSAGRIAVSLEPAGGSKTGSPTGPVLYVAEVSSAG